jgi:NAD-dependent dihydropyrimidine dehydrogenase PreA subunit
MYRLSIDVKGARLVPVNQPTHKLVVIDKKHCKDLHNNHYYDVIKILKDTKPDDPFSGVQFVEAVHLSNCIECKRHNEGEYQLIEIEAQKKLQEIADRYQFTGFGTPIQAVEGYMWLDFNCQEDIIIPKYLHWWQAYGTKARDLETIQIRGIDIELFVKIITYENIDLQRHSRKLSIAS